MSGQAVTGGETPHTRQRWRRSLESPGGGGTPCAGARMARIAEARFIRRLRRYAFTAWRRCKPRPARLALPVAAARFSRNASPMILFKYCYMQHIIRSYTASVACMPLPPPGEAAGRGVPLP